MTFLYIQERTDAWHALRKENIGGTEIAALFNINPPGDDEESITAGFSESAYSLHYIKGGIVEPRQIEGELLEAGIAFEPVIAGLIANRRGWVIEKGAYAKDDVTRGMGASLDYVILRAGEDASGVPCDAGVIRGIEGPLIGPGVFQIKQVGERQFRRAWINREPPPYVLLQVQHEIACSGYLWGVVGAWVGGTRMALYFYRRRDDVIDAIRSRVRDFWYRIETKTPPQPDGSEASARVLRELFPHLRDTSSAPVDLTGNNELPTLCAELKTVTKQRLALEKREADLENRVKDLLGDATDAVTQGFRIHCAVTPSNPGRLAKPGEIIGARRERRRYTVKEIPS